MFNSGLAILEKVAEYVKSRTGENPIPSLYLPGFFASPRTDYGLYFNSGVNLAFYFYVGEKSRLDQLWKEGHTLATVKSNGIELIQNVIGVLELGMKKRLDKSEWLRMSTGQITVDAYNLLLKKLPNDKILGFRRSEGPEEAHGFPVEKLVVRLLEKETVDKFIKQVDEITSQGIIDPMSFSANGYEISGGLIKLGFPEGFNRPPTRGDIHVSLKSTNAYSLDLGETKNLLPPTSMASEAIIHIMDDLEKFIDHCNVVNRENYKKYFDSLPPGSFGRYVAMREGDMD